MRTALLALLTAGPLLLTAGTAWAGMVTTVVVQNDTAYTLFFKALPDSTLGVVRPLPIMLDGGRKITFTVTSPYTNIAAIHLRLENPSQGGCRFDTAYTSALGYTKKTTAVGLGSDKRGCFVAIPAFDAKTHDYTVTFTIK